LLGPHARAKVFLWVDYFVVSIVDEEARTLHLASELSHHACTLSFVLVSLHLTFKLIRVVVRDLVCLGEGMVECDARTVIAEASKVRFGPVLLFYNHSYHFDLVVSQSDFDLKLVGHHEFVGFN
jgi:hypothetical protein